MNYAPPVISYSYTLTPKLNWLADSIYQRAPV